MGSLLLNLCRRRIDPVEPRYRCEPNFPACLVTEVKAAPSYCKKNTFRDGENPLNVTSEALRPKT
jgi:hypothetical protein